MSFKSRLLFQFIDSAQLILERGTLQWSVLHCEAKGGVGGGNCSLGSSVSRGAKANTTSLAAAFIPQTDKQTNRSSLLEMPAHLKKIHLLRARIDIKLTQDCEQHWLVDPGDGGSM